MNVDIGYFSNTETWVPYYETANDLKKLPSYYKFRYFLSMFSMRRNVLSKLAILIILARWNVLCYGNYYNQRNNVRKQNLETVHTGHTKALSLGLLVVEQQLCSIWEFYFKLYVTSYLGNIPLSSLSSARCHSVPLTLAQLVLVWKGLCIWCRMSRVCMSGHPCDRYV